MEPSTTQPGFFPEGDLDQNGRHARGMNTNGDEGYFGVWWRTAMWTLILWKIWLVAAIQITPTWPSPYDDWLFLEQTEHLLNGEWLGTYTHLTLAKGPMFSLFMAAAFVCGIPLSLAKAALYSAACVLVAMALRPLCPRRAWRFGLFVVLLFLPITYDVFETNRLFRQALLPSLVLLILASLIALYGRRAESPRKQLPWAVLLGLALSAFWLTREESVWILPSVAPVWLYLIWAVWRRPIGCRMAHLGIVLVLPVCLWGTGLGTVALLNRHYYGVFTTCEFKHRSFKAAYGSLLRVKHTKDIRYVPVPRETRARIYAVSAAFRELLPHLEGNLGRSWANASAGDTGLSPEDREIAGGYFVWALREAVSAAGHARTGAEAMAFYERLAREVNDACDRGRLAARSKRTGFLTPLRWNQSPAILATLAEKMRNFFCLEEVGLAGSRDNSYEVGSPGELNAFGYFSYLTHTQLTRPGGSKKLTVEQEWDATRLAVLEIIVDGYIWAFPYTSAAAVIALLVASCLAVARRRLPFFLVFSWGCLASVLIMSAIIALMEVTCNPGISVPAYLRGGYGMWLLCQFTVCLALAETVGFPRKNVNPGQSVDGRDDESQSSPERSAAGEPGMTAGQK